MAAAVHLQGGDRGRGPPAPARHLRRHAAAFRSDGAALPRTEADDVGRAVAAHDGLERQCHRARGPAGRTGPPQPPPLAQGSARANGDWIADMLADLSSDEIDALMRLLAKTKASARKAIGNGGPR